MAWKQPPSVYRIWCSWCGNTKPGTFTKVMIKVKGECSGDVYLIQKPRHYRCGECRQEVHWRPRIENIYDPLERI